MSDCKICISITATNTDDCITQMAEAFQWSDILELRLDYMESPDLPRILSKRPCPVIVTNRPQRERGKFKGTEAERIGLLEEAAELGAEYIDIEMDSVNEFRNSGNAKRIISYHNFEGVPKNIETIHSDLVKMGADIIKLACFAHSLEDSLEFFRLLRRSKTPTIALCMGKYGKISRILAPKYGSFLTFASLQEGAESAPGQLPARTLSELYRFRKIDAKTEVYGVIGRPVEHSMSPHIHNAAFELKNMNRIYVPLLVDDVRHFLQGCEGLGFAGFSVTVPHKETAIASLDEIDPIAEKIGAINTIVIKEGKMRGSNTDWEAAIHPIEETLIEQGAPSVSPLKDRRVVLIGAGGVGRAIAFSVQERGGILLIANRTKSRAVRLAEELGCEAISHSELLQSNFKADVLINASSIGMTPRDEETPIPKDFLHPSTIVFDAVYNPIQTRLLKDAKEMGCKIISGVEMFVRQAAAQFECWTGETAPKELMDRVVRERLEASHP